MMEKFQNIYRINSHRMPQWDYSGDGVYFITLVTQNRECILGHIVKTPGHVDTPDTPVETHGHVETHGRASLQLSDIGKIVDDEWLKSFEIRNELILDEYVMMPNHLHAIIILKNTGNKMNVDYDASQSAFIRKPKSISSFIAGFKSAVNSKIDNYIDEHHLDIPKYNRDNHFFQPNYHDHIIRNETEYQRITEYIINNPLKWNDDKFNSTNPN